MSIAKELRIAWNPHLNSIHQTLRSLADAPIPEECDFLWFVLYWHDLEGFPIMVWPTERNQQQHDGWAYQHDLHRSVPKTVHLPEDFANTPEVMDELRDATAEFLREQWNAIDPPRSRLAYFSLYEDGYYFSMRDGRKISAGDLETEISEQAAADSR